MRDKNSTKQYFGCLEHNFALEWVTNRRFLVMFSAIENKWQRHISKLLSLFAVLFTFFVTTFVSLFCVSSF